MGLIKAFVWAVLNLIMMIVCAFCIGFMIGLFFPDTIGKIESIIGLLSILLGSFITFVLYDFFEKHEFFRPKAKT